MKSKGKSLFEERKKWVDDWTDKTDKQREQNIKVYQARAEELKKNGGAQPLLPSYMIKDQQKNGSLEEKSVCRINKDIEVDILRGGIFFI